MRNYRLNGSLVHPASVGATSPKGSPLEYVLSTTTLSLIEGGASGAITCALSRQPEASVTVSIASSDTTSVTVDDAEFTFTTSDWATPQTVNASAISDVDTVDETPTITFSSPDVPVNGTVTVTVTDARDNTHALDCELSNSDILRRGSDDAVLRFTNKFTAEMWLDLESAPGAGLTRGIVAKSSNADRGWRIYYYNNSGTMEVRVQVADDNTNWTEVKWATTLTLSTWKHLAITCDLTKALASAFNCYINAVSLGASTTVSDDTVTSIRASTVVAHAMGLNTTGWGSYQDGIIDELRLWNVERTAAQILASYQYSFSTTQTGLVAAWCFDNVYTDYSGSGLTWNGNGGTPTFVTTPLPF